MVSKQRNLNFIERVAFHCTLDLGIVGAIIAEKLGSVVEKIFEV